MVRYVSREMSMANSVSFLLKIVSKHTHTRTYTIIIASDKNDKIQLNVQRECLSRVTDDFYCKL